jgi:hypothetical protein
VCYTHLYSILIIPIATEDVCNPSRNSDDNEWRIEKAEAAEQAAVYA